MPIRTKAKPPEAGPSTTPDRPISITAVVDPVAALAALAVRGNLYLYDTNKTEPITTELSPALVGRGPGTGVAGSAKERGWPPMPKITSLVFLDIEKGDEEDVAERRIFTELKIYGMPDSMRSQYTPVYYYWAGAIQSTAPPGLYRYRLVLELEQENKKEKLYLSTTRHPSIRVIGV
jgi:hypothetical protein